jgi:hypothetical protein
MSFYLNLLCRTLFLSFTSSLILLYYQVQCFDQLFSALQPGGVYIVEDVEVSYWTHTGRRA